MYLIKLDDVCANFTPEVANSSFLRKKDILQQIIYLNHRLNIFNFVDFENSEGHIKIYEYLKDLSFYQR